MTREDSQGERERERERENGEKAAAARGRLGQRGEERSRGEEEPKLGTTDCDGMARQTPERKTENRGEKQKEP